MTAVRSRLYRSVHSTDGQQRFYSVGIDSSGELYNPNAYPEADVRAALAAAEERRRQRRSNAAHKAAATRERRKRTHLAKIADQIARGSTFSNRLTCVACRRALTDPESIARGIGSECWQEVLAFLERRPAA